MVLNPSQKYFKFHPDFPSPLDGGRTWVGVDQERPCLFFPPLSPLTPREGRFQVTSKMLEENSQI